MLSGISEDVPKEELSAVMFSQYYADARGYFSEQSWERMIEIYGLKKAKGILASIRIMMLGNAVGIPWSSFINRFKGKPDERSSLVYEISLILGTIIFLPITLIHAFVAKLFNRSSIEFKIA